MGTKNARKQWTEAVLPDKIPTQNKFSADFRQG